MNKIQWIEENSSAYTWYKQEYPFLEEFSLPIDETFLKTYYKKDITERNLPISNEVLSNYDLLFSYFLANYTVGIDDKFQGQTDLGYIISSIPKGISKTVTQAGNVVSSVFDFAKWTIPALIILGIIIFIFINKKK